MPILSEKVYCSKYSTKNDIIGKKKVKMITKKRLNKIQNNPKHLHFCRCTK